MPVATWQRCVKPMGFMKKSAQPSNKGLLLMFLQGLSGLQSLDLSLNGLSTIPLGLLDELQSLR